MNDLIEYKVSFGVRVETNRPEVNKRTRNQRTRNRKQYSMIPFMTVIGAILQPIVSAVLQYSFPK